MTTVNEALDKFINEEKIYSMEGRRGVENLCTIARQLGYKDPMYWGQLSSKAILGDLILMLEDNSGMIEAMIKWIGNQRSAEWISSLQYEDDGDSLE